MGGKVGAPAALIVKGKRLDGRTLEEFRKIEAKAGNLISTDGSGFFAFGNTKAIAGVFGPRTLHPKFMQNPRKAIIRCKYAMAPFSTGERVRPGHSRRGTEISKVIEEALSSVVFFDNYPKTVIDVFMEIIQADASTRCAALNAASMALASAGVPMKNLICSCSVGMVDGKIVLDVGGKEDNFGDVDTAMATIGNEDKIVLLQLDGTLSKEDFFKELSLGLKGCSDIFDIQASALKDKYATNSEGDENGKE